MPLKYRHIISKVAGETINAYKFVYLDSTKQFHINQTDDCFTLNAVGTLFSVT
jgi:hypothetical protein